MYFCNPKTIRSTDNGIMFCFERIILIFRNLNPHNTM